MKNDIWALSQVGDLGEAELIRRSPLLDAKVMMVDDEPLMTELLQTHLEEEGYKNFVVANDPLQALGLLRREEPAVLLLDLMMPAMSGFDLIDRLRERHIDVPAVVISAQDEPRVRTAARAHGASHFLPKPFLGSALIRALDSFCQL